MIQDRRLEEAQYKGCMVHPVEDKKWEEIVDRFIHLGDIFGLGISREKQHLTLLIDGTPGNRNSEHFRWVIPKGELKDITKTRTQSAQSIAHRESTKTIQKRPQPHPHNAH